MYLEFSCILLCGFLATCVFWTRSPFMALMFTVMLFMNSSVILFILGFEFLALINLIIYVGALAVLFLFVIMLLEIPSTELRAYNRGWSTLLLLAILALRQFNSTRKEINTDFEISNLWSSVTVQPGQVFVYLPTLESISSIGYAFYIRYADLLILNSLILTVALFGALVLANTRS